MPSPIQGPQFQAQPWRTLPVTYPASAPTPLSALSGTITDDFNRTDYVFPVTQQSGSNFIDAPAGLVAGDLMLLVICTGAGGVFSAGPTGGWTLVSELTNAAGGGFDCRARLYYRTATSADIATTYTWTTTAGSVHAALTAYRGATGISATTTGTTGTADSYTAPTTTTASNELMVTVFAAATDSTSAGTTRFTTNAPIDEVLATSNFFHCGITDDVDLGRTSAVTATMTAGYHPSWVSWTLAIAGVRRTVPSLGAPWVTVTQSTDPKSLGSVFGIVGGRAQALHDDGVFGATYTPQVYVNASVNGTLDYDFASYFSNDAVLVRYDPTTFLGYAVSGTVVIAPDGSTVTNTLTGGLGYVNGSWSGLSGHARIVASGTDLDVYRDGIHEFHGVMSSNLDKTRFAIQATTGITFWDNFAWTSVSLSRWVVGAIGWGGLAAVVSGPIIDNFNRANSSSLGTTSDGNATWTDLIGANGISSNRAANVSYSTDGLDSRAISYIDPGSADGTLQATLHVSGTTGHFTPCLAFRIQDDKHMWLLGAAGLIKVSFASGTIQFTSIISPGYVDGDVAKVVLSGSTIAAYKNGLMIGSGPITDSSYVTETKHGIFFEDEGVGITQSLDDWSWSP